jgi:hypothetical protein
LRRTKIKRQRDEKHKETNRPRRVERKSQRVPNRIEKLRGRKQMENRKEQATYLLLIAKKRKKIHQQLQWPPKPTTRLSG